VSSDWVNSSMWEQIRSNKMKSAFLVVGVAAFLFALGYFLAELFAPGMGLAGLATAFVLWIVLTLVSYFGGDKIFLTMAGARKIEKQDLPQLYNVVEEMTIASGLKKMPDIYVIDDRAPNAFATGRNPDRAAVAVTSGLLKLCNRDELQGVVAHEIGHIQNRDILLMLIAGAMVGSIVLLADLGVRALWFGGRSRSRSSRRGGGGQAQVFILIVALLLMILAPLIAHLIYFALSRRREYLADASSALYTRYPEGLASALEKLAASHDTLRSASRATAPMYIVNPLKQQGLKATDLSSTHPPISERVAILRSMAGVSFADYDQAYRRVARRKSPVIPASARSTGAGVSTRAPAAGQETKERARQVNDFFWRLNRFLFLACPCGVVLKRPPDFKQSRITCPHCGRVHEAKDFKEQKEVSGTSADA